MKNLKIYNKKTRQYQWQTRFVINGKQIRPKADTEAELKLIVAEIYRAENREKINSKHRTDMEINQYIPTLAELFEKVLKTISHPKQTKFAGRVFNDFLNLLPLHIKVNKLTTSDFQTYIEHRQSLLGEQTNEPLKPQTINKELYAISGGLKKAPRFYSELENWKRPPIPFLKEKNSSRELNFNQKKFDQLLAALRKKRTGRQTILAEKHRNRLADELEFRLETGLRRKEVTMLKFTQYIEDEGILKNVQRFKTGTVTKLFPLTRKAIELIEAKKAKAENSKFIFSVDGRPIESDYRTLKKVCGELGIPYGRFTEEGFVPHDLRHQAATEIVRVTDIETAREYLGHSNVNQTIAYLHTAGERLIKARDKRDEIKVGSVEVEELLRKNYALIKEGLLTEQDFVENMKKFLRS